MLQKYGNKHNIGYITCQFDEMGFCQHYVRTFLRIQLTIQNIDYLNLMAFNGDTLLTNIEGTTSTIKQITSVAKLSSNTSFR